MYVLASLRQRLEGCTGILFLEVLQNNVCKEFISLRLGLHLVENIFFYVSFWVSFLQGFAYGAGLEGLSWVDYD